MLPSYIVLKNWKWENDAFWHWGMKAIKIPFLLVVIMLFSSLVAISPAAYNFPVKAIIIRTVWMDQYDVEMQIADMLLKVTMNNHMKLYTFSRRRVSLHIHIQP